MNVFKAGAAVAVMGLSACGGTTMTEGERLNSLDDLGDEIFDTLISGEDVLAASALPNSGSADFTGPIITRGGVGNPGNDTDQVRVAFLGRADVNINFSSGRLTGTIDDFIDVENFEDLSDNDIELISGGEVTGTLVIQGDEAGSSDAEYDVSVTGRLDGPGGAFLDYDNVGGSAEAYGSGVDALRIRGGANVQFDGQDGFISYAGVAAQ